MNRYLKITFASLPLILVLLLLCACNDSDAPQALMKEKEKRIPKLKFHLPKTFPKGVARIRELLNVINSEGELPEPIRYQALEIVHGSGSAAHSHFYLLDEEKRDQIEDHGHETTGEIVHDIEVDWCTELTDLVNRLPKIAISGDMDEATWMQVKQVSSTMSELLESTLENLADDASKREAIKDKTEAMGNLISQLEKLVQGSSDFDTEEEVK